MTLIAITTNGSLPVMIGDVLITSEQVERAVSIPTHLGGVNHRLPADQKLFPYQLNRKIYVVRDRLAVGLAGSSYEMKEFLGELDNYFKYRDLTTAYIDAFLEEFGSATYPNISAMLQHAVDNEQGVRIDYYGFGKWNYMDTEQFGKVYTCGSGSWDFLREAGGKWTTPVDALGNALTRAISRNFCLLANILGQEKLSLATIKKYWGAGFEIIYFDGQQFRTLDDITIVLWGGRLEVATGKFDVAPLTTLNYRYSSDGKVLIIGVADPTGCKAYGVLPLNMRPEEIDPATMPTAYHFDARRICFAYVLEVAEPVMEGNEATITYVSPTFYTEKSPDMPSVSQPAGTPNMFRSTDSAGNIPNLGPVKVDFSPDGDVKILVQEGIHQMIVGGMRDVLLPRLLPDGTLAKAPNES